MPKTNRLRKTSTIIISPKVINSSDDKFLKLGLLIFSDKAIANPKNENQCYDQ